MNNAYHIYLLPFTWKCKLVNKLNNFMFSNKNNTTKINLDDLQFRWILYLVYLNLWNKQKYKTVNSIPEQRNVGGGANYGNFYFLEWSLQGFFQNFTQVHIEVQFI